jgi:hypothetical protein
LRKRSLLQKKVRSKIPLVMLLTLLKKPLLLMLPLKRRSPMIRPTLMLKLPSRILWLLRKLKRSTLRSMLMPLPRKPNVRLIWKLLKVPVVSSIWRSRRRLRPKS